MSVATISSNRVETYLTQLEAGLKRIVPEQRDEILREIRAHILDSVAGATDPDAAVDRVLRLLGSPKILAQRYVTDAMLTRASRSYSPWFLMRAAWRLAKLGGKGVLIFFLALFGYATALGFTVSLFLKPFMPDRVGLWFGNGSLSVGTTPHPEQMRELLGSWFVPVIAGVAFAIAVGTTHALRRLVRKRPAVTA